MLESGETGTSQLLDKAIRRIAALEQELEDQRRMAENNKRRAQR